MSEVPLNYRALEGGGLMLKKSRALLQDKFQCPPMLGARRI